MIPIEMRGKVAVVTGASQGLGLVTATRLHEAGASVAINYYPDKEGRNARNAERAVAGLGSRARAFACDVTDGEAVGGMFEAVEQALGGVDMVVNNAAILRDRSTLKIAEADWQAVIDTNLTGVFNVCRVAAGRLRDDGRIVNMGSISGSMGFYGQVNYAAAKAGVAGMSRVLSRELARRRITVNVVAPGVVLTDMGKSIPEEARDKMLVQVPLGRFAEPSEIADAVLFLCSDLARYVTGQTLHVNGGWYA